MSEPPSTTPTYSAPEHEAPTLLGGGATAPGAAEPARVRKRGDEIGRYVVLEELGRGGMGVVYAAYDPQLDRKVAVKVVSPAVAGSARERGRLLREARALAQVNHRNVVTVHDVGEVGKEVFVAMEFLAGRTLEQWVAETKPDWREAVEVYVEAGQGLFAAHAAGLVHRDFKPENVILTEAGRVVVLDFGIAQVGAATAPHEIANDQPGSLAATVAAGIVGTPAYMSPEAFAGESLDAATDQYSFCLALWEAVHGQSAFAGDTAVERQTAVLTSDPRPPPPRSAPAWLHRALTRGLARRPSDRFPSMEELLAKLQTDRGSWRGPAALVFVAAAAVGIAVVGGPEANPVMDECLEPVRGEDDYDAQARAQIEEAFGSDGRAGAAALGRRVTEMLDEQSDALRVETMIACQAQRAPQPLAADGDSLGCLDRERARLSTLASVLLLPDTDLLQVGPRILSTLKPPSNCRAGRRIGFDFPEPDDPALAERVADLRMEATGLDVYKVTGRFTEGAAAADALIEQAKPIGYAPLLAYTKLQRVHFAVQLNDWDKVGKLAREALVVAVEHGFDHVAVEAIVALARVALLQGDYPRSRLLYEIALAMSARVGNREVTANIHVDLARLSGRDGSESKKAVLAHLHRAIDEYGGRDSNGLVVAYDVLLTVLIGDRRFEEAAVAVEKALQIGRRHLGDDHPLVGALHVRLGMIEEGLGRPDGAVEAYTEAWRIVSDAADVYTPLFGASAWRLSASLLQRDDLPAAIEVLEQTMPRLVSADPLSATNRFQLTTRLVECYLLSGAIDDAERVFATIADSDDDHPVQSRVSLTRAQLRLAKGDTTGAREVIDSLIADLEAEYGITAPLLARPLAVSAAAWLDLGDPERAVVDAERAIAVYELAEYMGEEPDDFVVHTAAPRAHFTAARALRALGRHGDAKRHHDAALEAFERRPGLYALELASARDD